MYPNTEALKAPPHTAWHRVSAYTTSYGFTLNAITDVPSQSHGGCMAMVGCGAAPYFKDINPRHVTTTSSRTRMLS